MINRQKDGTDTDSDRTRQSTTQTRTRRDALSGTGSLKIYAEMPYFHLNRSKIVLLL